MYAREPGYTLSLETENLGVGLETYILSNQPIPDVYTILIMRVCPTPFSVFRIEPRTSCMLSKHSATVGNSLEIKAPQLLSCMFFREAWAEERSTRGTVGLGFGVAYSCFTCRCEAHGKLARTSL